VPEVREEEIRLSPSEKQTLRLLAAGEYGSVPLDWVALQRLKRCGLAEEHNTGRVGVTREGMRVLKRLQAQS
jgi:ribosomal protein S19E (S16A)